MNMRKNKELAGSPLLLPTVISVKYSNRVGKFFHAMAKETREDVMSVNGANMPAQVKGVLKRVHSKYNRLFNEKFPLLIKKMLIDIDKASSLSVSTSMKELSQGLIVKPLPIGSEMFKALTQQNVGLFKTIAPEFFAIVENKVMDSIAMGNGMKDLIPFFNSYSNGHKNYAKNRALDQTRKAFTSINMTRLKKVGIQKVEWMHSHGSNDPRKLHQELDGKVFDVNNPPFIGVMYGQRIHGFGGVLPYCRCTVRPIIDFNERERQ